MDRWPRVRAVAEEALELPPSERHAFLAAACDDESMRAEVEALLRADDGESSLGLPGREVLHGWLEEHMTRLLAGKRIGSFRIRRMLGSGGMGTVYEAEQDSPRRLVALKTMRVGLTSPHALRRFQWETEVLAHLQHPGIAQVYEAGVHAEEIAGRRFEVPFFAMELVDGARTLPQFAAEEGLDLRGRLHLFVDVCHAVQEGHRRGVIHRDLKPGNVLVSREGRVKVIDFGVARATDHGGGPATMTREAVGTLRYMSPEQIAGSAAGLDVRTDVYSLGVVLYELLGGAAPYADIGAALRGDEPVPLGRRAPRLRGDIERLVHKAMHRERDQRYGSAGELARDVERWLEGLPIAAGPASAFYRLRKLAARYRFAAAFLLLAGLGVVGGAMMAAAAWWEARIQREQAQDEAALNAATVEFVREILLAAHPHHQGPDATVRDVVAATAERIDAAFPDRPWLAAKLHHMVGQALRGNGSFDTAAHHLGRAWELSKALADAARDEDELDWSLGVGCEFAGLLADIGRVEEGVEVTSTVVEIARRERGADDAATRSALSTHAILLSRTGRGAEAVDVILRLLAAAERIHGTDSIEALAQQNSLVGALTHAGRLDEAEQRARHVRERMVASLGDEHPKAQVAVFNHADVLRRLGRYDEAGPAFARLTEVRERQLGAAHPHTMVSRRKLLGALLRQQCFAEAEAVVDRGIAQLAGSEATAERLELELNRVDIVLCAGRREDAARRLDELEREHGAALHAHMVASLRQRLAAAEGDR